MRHTFKQKALTVVLAVSMFFLSIPVNLPVYAMEENATLPDPTVTLDFLPEDLIAEAATPEYSTAVINTTTIKLYKSLDTDADGIEVTVEAGTVIELVTKYTFTISDTEVLEFYRYDYSGVNTVLAEAALSESSGYVFVYAGDITITDSDTILEEIYWELLETVSKEGYDEVKAKYAKELTLYTFSDEQQAVLDAHYELVPYTKDIVYVPWSGRIGPLMPPVTLVSPYARMAYTASSLAEDDTEPTLVDNSALKTSKIVTENGDGSYTITIEAYAEGQVTVTTSKTACDVVLVLDMSSSMGQSFGSTTRFKALKEATIDFVNSINTDAKGPDGIYGTNDDTDHRVSIITYQKSATIECPLKNVATEAGYNVVAGEASGLDMGQKTRADLGLAKAIDVFDGNGVTNDTVASTTRQRVVIFFTDGYPTESGSNHFNAEYAKDAINYAKVLKNDYGAAVYSVAVLNNASPTGTITTSGSSGENPDIGIINGYLHAVSSNYPTASATYSNKKITISLGTGGNNDYYISASTPDDLNGIFNTVSNTVISGSTSVDLGIETVVKDIVTPYFVIPNGTSGVIVQTAACTGYSNSTYQWGMASLLENSIVKVDGNTLDVSGFDFTHNFVASTARKEYETDSTVNFYGRKLIISFTITPAPDFLGGDEVPTNETASGIYAGDGTQYENLIPNPNSVDVPLKEIETVALDKHVYYGNTIDLTGILNLHVNESTSGKYLQDIANGVNNAYVDLVYQVTMNGQIVAIYTIPAGKPWNEGIWTNGANQELDMSKVKLDTDTPYGIVCTMTSINDASNKQTENGTATVYVYKPELTFKDVTKTPKKDYVNYESENLVSTAWKRADGILSTSVTMEGTAPTLTLTYTSDTNGVDENSLVIAYHDFYVNVMVKNEDTDITSAVTFVHESCNPACAFDASKGEFMIHVALTTLTICKAGYSGYETIDSNQTFLFKVTGDNLDLIVSVHGDSSIIIEGLAVGQTYTIAELTDWSWRYSLSNWVFVTDGDTDTSGNLNGAEVTLGTSGNAITFTNTRTNDKWLDGDSYVVNIFNKNS